MKKNSVSFIALFLLTATAGLFAPLHPASAQTNAQDSAAAYDGIGWYSGTNFGFGFQPWTLTATNDGGTSGFFIGNGGQIATANNSAWGLYANGGSGGNAAVAYRSFTNGLATNSVFKIRWRTAGIGGSVGNSGGFVLRNGNANSSPADARTNERFEFYFIGGGSNSFVIYDGNGVNYAGIGFRTSGLLVEFILVTPDTYRLVIREPDGSAILLTLDNQPLLGSGTIDSVALYAFQTDGDQVFNNMEIYPASLIPPEIVNLAPANNSIYATNTQLSFDVLSPFSGVSTNGITLILNGATQSNLTISGDPASNHIVFNTALLANLVYTGTIRVVDVNGNRSTNNFSFNTWGAGNPFIEAEDYNFSSGQYIDNFANPSPHRLYENLTGSNAVDHLEYVDGGTNTYRPNDTADTEITGDGDHNDFASNFYTDYNLSFIQFGEWENYTRRLSNATYTVYARMASLSGDPTMLLERLATTTATASNQPTAALGTFVCPADTGGGQSYTFVQLKDFFSNPVEIRFSGTNTFRTTRIGGSYNFNYIILVPSTNAATLRPYLTAGFPFPGATGIALDQTISFTIANRQTTVTPASIKLYLNSSNVTSGISLSNNNAGTVVTYPLATLLTSGSTNTLRVEFTDSGSISQTNEWQFTATTLPVVPSGYALESGSGINGGFNIHIAKAPNEAPGAQFPATAARADNHLANLITNSGTSLPWTNEAGGAGNNGLYSETNVINYNQVIEFGSSGITNDALFPNVAPTLSGSYTNDPNYISMEAIAYVQLTAGIHKWAVRCDDGFRLTFGTGSNPTNYLVSEATPGSDSTATEFEFVVQADGVYPMRLLFFEGTSFANLEFYSINRTNGQVLLINTNDVNSIKAYRLLVTTTGVTLSNMARAGTTASFTFETQSGKTHYVEYKTNLNSGSWSALTAIAGNGSVTNVTDTGASVPVRFYRVRTQ